MAGMQPSTMSARAASHATLKTLLVDVSARAIATVVLNRPQRGNAFDQTMLEELAQTFSALAADDAVRVVVLRGNGKHFCTGADLGARAGESQLGSAQPEKPPVTLRDVLAALDTLPKPTVAVVHGAAIGGAVALVACCDVALADV